MTASPRSIFQVGHLERVPLGTLYPAIVAHVGRLLTKLPGRAELVIDFTGVGRPIFDMFVYSGIFPIGVVITAGNSETCIGPNFWRIFSRNSAPIRGHSRPMILIRSTPMPC